MDLHVLPQISMDFRRFPNFLEDFQRSPMDSPWSSIAFSANDSRSQQKTVPVQMPCASTNTDGNTNTNQFPKSHVPQDSYLQRLPIIICNKVTPKSSKIKNLLRNRYAVMTQTFHSHKTPDIASAAVVFSWGCLHTTHPSAEIEYGRCLMVDD